MCRKLTATLLLGSLGWPSSAMAFTEDLCFSDTPLGRRMTNCYAYDPASDECPPGDVTQPCQLENLPDVALMLARDGRSMVHFDATYVLAQTMGFSADEAHLLAAYDQAADVVRYVPFDRNGDPVIENEAWCDGSSGQPEACKYRTIDIAALNRLDFDSGGALLHYMAPHNHGGAGTDAFSLDPRDLDPTAEEMLLGWREWATYQRPEGCTLGLESALGCYGAGPGTAKRIVGALPVLADVGLVPIVVELGEQVFRWDEDDDAELVSSEFDAAVGDVIDESANDAWLARFGLYLHFLQDRVSHTRCSDSPNTEITGPLAGGHYDVDYDTYECAAPIHGLRHSWEVGRDQSQLDPADRTTEHALRLTYEELMWFAGEHQRERAFTPDQDALIADLVAALETPEPLARVEAMDAVALAWGVEPMPY